MLYVLFDEQAIKFMKFLFSNYNINLQHCKRYIMFEPIFKSNTKKLFFLVSLCDTLNGGINKQNYNLI